MSPRWILAVAAVLAAPSVAHAGGRTTTLSVSGGLAVMGDVEATDPDQVGTLLVASVTWDHPAPDLPPEAHTATARGDVVPELSLVALGDRGGALAGVRFELDLAQRAMGLFRISSRMSMWIAPRVGVLDAAAGPVYGGDVGAEYFVGHAGWRFGYSLGALSWHEPGAVDTPVPVNGAIAFRAGAPGSQQLAITAGIIIAR